MQNVTSFTRRASLLIWHKYVSIYVHAGQVHVRPYTHMASGLGPGPRASLRVTTFSCCLLRHLETLRCLGETWS
jgi:hypothetical protein